MLEWGRIGVCAGAVALWGLLVLDALPWGLDLDEGGTQGLVRCAALVATFALFLMRDGAKPVAEVYEAGRRAGYEAGRRAVASREVDSPDCRGWWAAAAAADRRVSR